MSAILDEQLDVEMAAGTNTLGENHCSVRIKPELFRSGLDAVKGAIAKATTIPVLTCVYIEFQENRIILRASNSDIQVESIIDDTENYHLEGRGGAFLLPGTKLIQSVSTLKGIKKEGGDILIHANGTTVELKGSGKVVELQSQDPNEFPRFPAFDETSSMVIPSGVLERLYKNTVFATSASQTKPILTGVQQKTDGAEFYCIATDSHRLSKEHYQFVNDLPEVDLIIPTNSIKEVVNLCKNSDMVHIGFGENQVLYQFDHTTMYSRIIAGTFPDVNRIIPAIDSAKSTATFKVANLLESLSDSLNFEDEKGEQTAYIKMITDKKQFRIESPKNQTHQFKADMIPDQVTGENIWIRVNTKYLIDAIKNYNKEDAITFYFNGNGAPFLVKKVGDDEENLRLVLPTRGNHINQSITIEAFNPPN